MAQAGTSQQQAIDYSVRNAQQMLNQLGYRAGPEDGMVGPRTRSGIRAYQRDKAMDADGRLTRGLFDRLSADRGRVGATERLRDLRERLPEESRRGIDRAIEGGPPTDDGKPDARGGRPGNAGPSMGRGNDMGSRPENAGSSMGRGSDMGNRPENAGSSMGRGSDMGNRPGNAGPSKGRGSDMGGGSGRGGGR